MATMYGQSKPVPFEPYGRRRKGLRLPRWLVLLLGGIAIGAGGVVLVQTRYLPPRLSADESARLRGAYEQADVDRARLGAELADTTKRLQSALRDRSAAADELAASHAMAERLRADLASTVESLPPDPRGGVVEVRAARFAMKGSSLVYDIVLTRDRGGSQPLGGAVQFVVAGDSPRGAEATTTPAPLPVSIGAQQVVRGSLAMADGFRARMVTVQVLERAGGRALGMRVMPVK
jgi:hypothetical protein